MTNLVNKLAYKFADLMADHLTDEEMVEVITVNRNNRGGSWEDCCHSGDLIDSNMVMEAAFREIGLDSPHLDCEVELMLWNSAWNVAKENDFFRGHLIVKEHILVIRHLSEHDAERILDFMVSEEEEDRCVYACAKSYTNMADVEKDARDD